MPQHGAPSRPHLDDLWSFQPSTATGRCYSPIRLSPNIRACLLPVTVTAMSIIGPAPQVSRDGSRAVGATSACDPGFAQQRRVCH